LLCLKLRYR